MASNQDETRRSTVRHLFLPGTLAFSTEIATASLALIMLNFASFEHAFFHTESGDTSFVSYSGRLFYRFLEAASQLQLVSQVIIFIMWAVAGMLVYLLLYRALQAIYGVSSSLRQGIGYVKTSHSKGLMYWFDSLYNFFISAVTILIGVVAFFGGIFLVFGIASQQMRNGLSTMWPDNLVLFIFTLLAVVVGVRLAIIGICILIPRFARWYLA